MGTSARGVVSPALATLDPLNLLLIMKKSMRFTVFFSVLAVTSASYAKIVSYEPGSDVTQHSRIDLDQADLESYVKAPYDWTNANAMYSNKLILAQFNLGQAKLLAGKCVEVQAIKDRIVQLMSVPLVQGALRYAYKVDLLSGADKEKAEMVAFTGAILPRVAVCSAKSAATIRSNMFIGGTVTAGFAAVKTAFEENYACMGLTCGDVGGLMLNDGYYAGFSPCVDASTPSSSGSSDGDDKNWAVPVVVVLSVVV